MLVCRSTSHGEARARRRLLYLRTGNLHERFDQWPCGVGRCARSHPHRAVRREATQDTGLAASERRPAHLPVDSSGSGPTISFARSGLNVCWRPSFRSLLELAEACDVPVRWSCRTGVCHACETGLVAGTIGYRPDPLDAPADGNVLICCSQPQGDVVIDL